MNDQRLAPLWLAACILPFAGPATGAGFALTEQGVGGLGSAYAGATAIAEDATTIFFNPAGMSRLAGRQVVAGVHAITPTVRFRGASATNVLGQPYSGGNGGSAGASSVVPNLYLATSLDSGWSAGLGIAAPFGLATGYDNTWVGRYHALKSEIRTIDIIPAVAYKVNAHLSVGGSVSARHLDTRLSNMVDFGLSAFSGLSASAQQAIAGGDAATAGALMAQANALIENGVVSNPEADVLADVRGDDRGYGFNLGLLYELDSDSRIGFAYRSRIRHTLKGKARFTPQNPGYLAAFGLDATARAAFPDQRVRADLTLPASASVGGYHRFNSRWAVMADIMWTEWSTFESLVVDFAGALPDSVTTSKWRDSWRYSAGVTYNPTQALTLRFGIAYDETPIRGASYRTPRIPDQDRMWTAIGIGYQLQPNLKLDFGYAHLSVPKTRLDKSTTDPENTARGNLRGHYDSSADIASVQLAYTF